MPWGVAGQNLLIGLRDGLETALLVSLLLGVLQRLSAATASERRSVPASWITLGVFGAVASASSCAAVLTHAPGLLSPSTRQEAEGLLGVAAVVLVVGELFLVQRLVRALPAPRSWPTSAGLTAAAIVLTLAAVVASGRGAIDTMSSVWPALRASGTTLSPVVGMLAGLGAAGGMCFLAHRHVVRLDLPAATRRIGVAVLGISAGVLADAVGRLQDVGWLPGGTVTAFDVRPVVDSGSWPVAIVSGVTALAPTMSVAQVGAWLVLVLALVPWFLARSRAVPATATTDRREGRDQVPVGERGTPAAPRARSVAGALVVVPCASAGLLVLALPAVAVSSTTTTVTVTSSTCASEWSSGHTGTQTFEVDNQYTRAGEIDLVDSSGGVVSWLEVIGPDTTVPMIATLGPGQYQFICHMYGDTTINGAPVQVVGPPRHVPLAVTRVTLTEMKSVNRKYVTYASGQLSTMSNDVATLRTALANGDVAAAKQDWLAAQLDWEMVAASYNSFGALGIAVDGLPHGLPGGVDDPDFTGLHRIEYGLYHGQTPASLVPIADQLGADVTDVRKNLSQNTEAGDPTTLTLRIHEVLEDALRDHLTGLDDQGSGMGYAETYADAQVTRTLLGFASLLLDARVPGFVDSVDKRLDRLERALLATKSGGQWRAPAAVTLGDRQWVDASIGNVLASLAAEPALLLVPPSHCVRDPTAPPHGGGTRRSSMPTTAPTTAAPTAPGGPTGVYCQP